jgi:hypothetical protein
MKKYWIISCIFALVTMFSACVLQDAPAGIGASSGDAGIVEDSGTSGHEDDDEDCNANPTACETSPDLNLTGICMENGSCDYQCRDGFGDCTDEPGCETDLTTPENCGTCGRRCSDISTALDTCRPAREGDAPGDIECNDQDTNCMVCTFDLTD